MAEEHVCIMLGEFKHIAEDMTDRKNNERDMQKNISDIRTSQEKTMFVTEQVQKTLESQARATEKNQELIALTNKENKSTMDAGFKAIEDRRIADEKATASEKKEAIKIKKSDNRTLQVAIFLMGLNLFMGILVKYGSIIIKFLSGN
jgi:hypothetical protein